MSSSVREYVLEQLAPGIPAGGKWKVEEGIPTLDVLSKPVLWVEYKTFAPDSSAPRTHLANGVDVCIATNLTDLRKGEAAADENVRELFLAALRADGFHNITATKNVFKEAYFGWRISLTVITKNDQE